MTGIAALRVLDVHKAFRARSVLRGVSFDVSPGELAGVVGENGAGKTTLLRILAGQLGPDRGEVELTGSLGYCPQHAVLNDALTVDQHLRLFQVSYRLPDLGRANELVERLGFADYRNIPVGVLSGGTRQKLNLVLALMHDPALLLLDEPYQGFDWDTYLHFWRIATELSEAGRAVLVVSHLAYDKERLDTLHRLDNGTLGESGGGIRNRSAVDSRR
ncbi:ABC-type multidrug transport system ATPase subunit [Saccharothrix tamanrassetensis]|uniref:ABC-type multidrug transport system ATPase subunit n=1 Tax=Saccharothrix tamanrassetensis TaxID=1051531 RepID=A0A841CQJ7_9PSEU|nr:ABC transporter ATP-binding protein [Saccharothrix tamanrassetensis]MBB5960692.1 ABC-type multidrug transport system ATPase subunit [Saccharothrix tamanrassetensis]